MTGRAHGYRSAAASIAERIRIADITIAELQSRDRELTQRCRTQQQQIIVLKAQLARARAAARQTPEAEA